MKILAVAFLVLVVAISLAYLQGRKVDSSSFSTVMPPPRSAAQAPPSQGAPVRLFPSKSQFVTTENDPVLVQVGVNCAGSQNPPRFELLPPTPAFVKLSLTCSPDAAGFAHALVAIAPGPGDAGKYLVKLGATSCGAPPDEQALEIINFSVKVKRAR